ncbi:MAG: response regulator, partial [Elusimicrobia bacterium]|nr:response regulator [Elusimicrobiota bacterium]
MARIVIVDDDTSFSGLLKQFLETRGHQILVAESVGVLQLRLREDRPDVVILDMQVPGGGAPSAAKLLEQDAGLRKLPILFCSGMPVEQMQRWFPPQAGRRYQMKPVDLDSVGRLIGELLGLPPAAAPAGRPAAAKPAPAPAKPAAQPAGAAPASSQAGPTALLSAVVQRELMALSKLHGEALGQGAERLVSAILTEAVRLGASDIHI